MALALEHALPALRVANSAVWAYVFAQRRNASSARALFTSGATGPVRVRNVKCRRGAGVGLRGQDGVICPLAPAGSRGACGGAGASVALARAYSLIC